MEICSLPSFTIPTPFSKPGILEKSSIHGQLFRFPNFGKNPPARKLKILEVRAQSSARMLGIDKSSIHGQLLNYPNFGKNPPARKLKNLDIRAQSSGTTKSSLGAVEAITEEANAKDDNVAFVAGATGKVGSRTVRELIKLGFRVRAGVRSAQRAQTLVQSVKQLKLDETEEIQPVEKLEIVECDLEKPSQIVPALGKASIVFCCIGASEKEVFDITGPYRIDYLATKNLIDAARFAKVKHFFLVSSLGTNKVGFPAAILNLFWGVLLWKRKAEETLIASGIPYTIVRPGGMERPTDAYKETHNLTLSKEDTLFGGQVSNLQVAELLAFMAKNLELSYCKVVEAIAETTAPLTPMEKLLEKIPSKRAPPKEPIAKKSPKPEPKPTLEPKAATVAKVATEPPSPTPPIEKEPELPKPVISRPLSPFAAYDDLKPPTSPTPTQATSQKGSVSPVDTTAKPETKPSPVEAKIERPLSPYAAYENLKPPTSPSPSASTGSTSTSLSSSSGEPKVGNSAPSTPPSDEKHEAGPGPKQAPLSPYAMYEDLKPPTSPSPSHS